MDGQNLAAYLSQLGRIKRQKAIYATDHEHGIYHPSYYGYICPHETPDGDATAKNINLSLGGRVSQDTSLGRKRAYDLIMKNGAESYDVERPHKVFLNGDWIASIM